MVDPIRFKFPNKEVMPLINSRSVKLGLDVLKTFAIVAAGIWAVYTFQAKRESLIAEAQQRKLSLEVAQNEKRANDSLVRAYITAKSIVRTDSGWMVVCALKFTNKGGADRDVFLDSKAIRLAKVSFGKTDSGTKAPKFAERQFTTLYVIPTDKPEVENRIGTPSSVRIKSGGEMEFLCFFEVGSAGVYYLEFQAKLGETVLAANSHFTLGLTSQTPEATPAAVSSPAEQPARAPSSVPDL